MPELIGGFQRAVGDVNTIKSTNYTNVLGAIGFGLRGEQYRVLFLNESSTFTLAASGNVFIESATAALTAAGQTATGFQPWIVQTAAATNQWAGQLVSSARGQGLALVQVGGPMTLTLTASGQAVGTDSIVMFIATNATGVQSAALASLPGAYAMINPGYSAGQSTIVAVMYPAPVFAF